MHIWLVDSWGTAKLSRHIKEENSVKAMVQFGSRNLFALGMKARYCSAQVPRSIWNLPGVPKNKMLGSVLYSAKAGK